MDKISLIVPCYNEQESLKIFYKKITEVSALMNVDFEYIFIDDGSKDKTLDICKELSIKDKRVSYISFSKNFGKEAAIYAGLENAKGDFVAVIDADLQDPPELIIQMYKILKEEDFDCVATRREDRDGEPPIRSFFANLFYKVINKISDADIQNGARDFRLMNRKFVDAVLQLCEYHRFSKGLFAWVGFKTKWLSYKNLERVAGTTKWSFWKLFKYSIEGIVSFSTFPLIISAFIGILFCFIALLMVGFIVIRTLMFGDPVSGWPSMTCIILLIGGIQLFSIGVVGQYLAKMYMEVKKRPIYIIREKQGD